MLAALRTKDKGLDRDDVIPKGLKEPERLEDREPRIPAQAEAVALRSTGHADVALIELNLCVWRRVAQRRRQGESTDASSNDCDLHLTRPPSAADQYPAQALSALG